MCGHRWLCWSSRIIDNWSCDKQVLMWDLKDRILKAT
jgi:hypothetical protein